MHVKRYEKNPILRPNPNHEWEKIAAFNGCPVKVDGITHLLYRALSDTKNIQGHDIQLSTIGHSKSEDGVTFNETNLIIEPENEWERFGCEDPRVTYIDGQYLICYTALSKFPFEADGIKVAIATSRDLETIQEKHIATTFNSKAMAIFPKKVNEKYTAILTVHTDKPPSRIAIAQFDSIGEMWSKDYWQKWYSDLEAYTLPVQRINRDHIEIGAPPVETEYGWLLIYSYIQDYKTSVPVFGIEAIMLDKDNPQHIIGRIDEPLFIPEEVYEKDGMIPNIVFPSGAIIEGNRLAIYYGATDSTCCVAYTSLEDLYRHMRISAVHIPKLMKLKDNPIMEPKAEHDWESRAVFNPTALYLNDSVHIIYRAMSQENTSVMGYAVSKDGTHIDERIHEPIYTPREPFEAKKNPGRNSGCEDGRITQIGDKLYMCYAAYNGVDVPRVALTSISIKDFLARDWRWEKPVIVSPDGTDDKDACIFPEKVNGKYVILHRIQGDIVVDYADDLAFDGERKLECHGYITAGKHDWDAAKIGICGPPVHIDDVWLLLYHGIHPGDKEYRIGAMLLDINDPVKVLARSRFPILEPEATFEREGIVSNVVFPCGMVVIDQTLYVYYGGADKVICVATYPCDKLIAYMKKLSGKKMLM